MLENVIPFIFLPPNDFKLQNSKLKPKGGQFEINI